MNRISELRNKLGISMKEAAARLDMPYTTYVNYEKGTREPNSETLIKLSRFFGTTIDYLLGKPETNIVPPGFEPLPEMATVPLVGRIACGQPITAEENLEGYVSIPAEWHATFTLLCEGDSMEPRIKDGDRTTVGEWAKIWLQTYKADLRHATVQMYRNAYNNHVRQVLGGMELRDVRPVHIRSVMSEVAGMSESLQNKVLLTMRQIFATAIDNGLLLRNPCDKIKITPHAKPRRKEYLTAAECDTLMEAVTEPRARAFVALCLYCGLRREEALGLKWTDLGADRLVVSRAMTFGSNQQLPVEELKKYGVLPDAADARQAAAGVGHNAAPGRVRRPRYQRRRHDAQRVPPPVDQPRPAAGRLRASPPHAAPHLRDHALPRGRRPAHRAAAARPRQHPDDRADLYPPGGRG